MSIIKKNNEKFIFISSRVSLARDFQRKTNGADLPTKFYQTDPIHYGDNVIIQYDSLPKIGKFISEYDEPSNDYVIYLDEINSLLNYLCSSSTLSSKRATCFYYFLNLIRRAKKVICTDNEISNITTDFFSAVCEKYKIDKPFTYWNNMKNWSGTPVQVYQDEAKLKQEIMNKISGGAKLNIVSDSKTVVDCYQKELDVDNEWTVQTSDQKYIDVTDWADVCIYSPKITIGVDDQTKKDIFLIVNGKSVDSVDLYQMVCRCREMVKLHVIFLQKEDAFKPCKFKTIADVDEHVKSNVSAYHEILENYNVINIEDEELVFREDRSLFYKIFRQHLYIKDIYSTGLSKHFINILEREKFDVTLDATPPKLKRLVKNTETKKLIKQEKMDNFDPCSEKVIELNQYLRLPKSERLKHKEIFIDKFELMKHWNTCKLFQNDKKLAQKSSDKFNEFDYIKSKSSDARISVLNMIQTKLQIGSIYDIDGFDQLSTTHVNVDKIKSMYCSAFEKNKKMKDCQTVADLFKIWACGIKTVCGDILKSKKVRFGDKTCNMHVVNEPEIDRHMNILNYRLQGDSGLKKEYQAVDPFIDDEPLSMVVPVVSEASTR